MRKSLKNCLLIAAASATAAVSVRAQVPVAPAASPYAVIEGVAIDSLHNDLLRGALIAVDGVAKPAFTDSLGKFRIDSVPPGSRRVHVLHGTLDTIGIALQTPLIELAAGQQHHLVLAIPSIATVIAARCTEGERRIGPAALLGVVQFAESETPATGAKVMLEFVEIRVSGKSVQSIPFRRIATVTESGRFKLCGLPDDLSGSLIAVNGVDSTNTIGIRLSSRVGLIGLELPDPVESTPTAPGVPGATATTVRRGNAILTGRVFDPAGAALPRARVSVNGDSAFALTDTDGRFALRNLRSGTRVLSVRRLGFEPAAVPVSLHSRSPTDVLVRLEQIVVVLDTVRVVALQDRALEQVGFTRRKKMSMGYYLGPDQISRSAAYDLTNLLAGAPMLRRDYSGGRSVITGRGHGLGGGCVTWWVDGMPWMGGGAEDFIRPDEVAAIEAYSSGFTPGEFTRPGRDCETIVVWTKQRVHLR
jgi:hypothetical protein